MFGVEAAGVLGKNQEEVFQVGPLQVMRDILESVKGRESKSNQDLFNGPIAHRGGNGCNLAR